MSSSPWGAELVAVVAVRMSRLGEEGSRREGSTGGRGRLGLDGT